jgi:hypothetical protein
MDARGQLLHDLDREASGLADKECGALVALAEAITRSLGEWRKLTSELELIAHWDFRRAGALVLESVFDELLAAPKWRFLSAALALTEPGE